MCRVLRVAAAIAAAALMSIVAVASAELATPARPAAYHYLLYGGFDLWRSGSFTHGGLLWSPGGLERDGFTFKLLVGGGSYRYAAGVVDISGNATLAALMSGWRFKRERLEVFVYGGLDFQRHSLSPDDPGNPVRGEHLGLRVGADLWWEPTARSMAAASVSLSSIGTNYWTRAAYGWRVVDRGYLGPELLALGGGSYWQYRLGAHATAFRTGDIEWSLGAGWVSDSDRRSGLYGRLSVLMRR